MYKPIIPLLVALSSTYSCSSFRENKTEKMTRALECSSSECEVEKYEAILEVLGKAESDLSNGNSFRALNNLERIREQASYHGKFKSLYKVATDTCITSTNELASKNGSCSLVRERTRFIKQTAPEKLLNLDEAIRKCNIDLSNNSESFILKDEPQIELSRSEAANLNLHDTIQEMRKKYNSNPWEELLLIDLKILSGYHFKLGKPELKKEMPRPETIRFIIPVSINFNGDNDSYCSQYKSTLHDDSFSIKRSCYDYPNASDFLTTSPPIKWTDNTYLTEFKVTNSSDRALRDIPFTKGYQKMLSLGIGYSSKAAIMEDLTVEFPGHHIPQNFLARMAYTQSFENKVKRPEANSTVLIAHSRESGVKVNLQHSRYFGFEVVLDLPVEMVKDLEHVSLEIPVKAVHDHYHLANTTAEP